MDKGLSHAHVISAAPLVFVCEMVAVERGERACEWKGVSAPTPDPPLASS